MPIHEWNLAGEFIMQYILGSFAADILLTRGFNQIKSKAKNRYENRG